MSHSTRKEKVGHTQGPWVVGVTEHCGIDVTSPDYVVCKVYADLLPEELPAEANARLIAAAPELLREAREVCAILDLYRAETGEEPCFDHEAIGEEVARRHDSIIAAIAKATGATS